MLGRAVADELGSVHEVWGTRHNSQPGESATPILWVGARLDAATGTGLRAVLNEAAPDAIINCIGITPSSPLSADDTLLTAVNSEFPHQLAREAQQRNAYVIHISTDGVFSGAAGPYTESDLPDSFDPYGISKLSGELVASEGLTLRATFFGPTPSRRGIVEWFLANWRAGIDGYTRYAFTGLSTFAIARVIALVLAHPQPPVGVYHLGGELITKYQLLVALARELRLDAVIRPVAYPVVNRALDSGPLWRHLGTFPPTIANVIHELGESLAKRGGEQNG